MYAELIGGAILVLLAALCALVCASEASSDEEEELGFFFFLGTLVAIFGTVGGLLLAAGVHRHWSHGAAAHRTLYRAATEQGYPVRDNDVHTGYYARIDLRVGRCLFTLDAKKVDGRWRFGVPESGQGSAGGFVFLSPAHAAKLAEVCP